MSNKYTEGAANVLLHLHGGHTGHESSGKSAFCPECKAGSDDILTNELPEHHIEFTCRCLKCGFQWMPNSEE